MKTGILKLKGPPALTGSGDATFLICSGMKRAAADEYQRIILNSLVKHEQTVDELTTLLCEKDPRLAPEQAALILAGFILDFSDFLEEYK